MAAYSYTPPSVPCTKCDKGTPINTLKHVPQTLFISFSGDVETDVNGDGRKSLSIIQVQATQSLCGACNTVVKRDRIKRMQEYDDIGIIEVGTEAADTFMDTYSDICGDHSWDKNQLDVYGAATVFVDDTSGTFTAGAIRDYSVAQYFTAAAEEKQLDPVEDDKDEDDDIEIMYKKGHFEFDELNALADFLDMHKFDKIYAMNAFLKKHRFAAYLTKNKIATRKYSAYARVYVDTYFYFCRI